MRLLKHYWKDRWKALLCAAVLTALSVFLFYLFDLPVEPLFYTFSILFVAVLCFAIPDFLLYHRKVRKLKQLQENLSTLWEIPAISGTLPETVLLDSLELLCKRLKELEQLSQERGQDMLEYYTLWVHQIKTPLSAMRLILQSAPGAESEALAQELFKVERYVEMALGYLRMETMSADLRLETCSAYDIVRQAVKKFAPLFIYQKLTLEFPEFENRVLTDEKWLGFAVEQLLSNALKYTKTGTITISMDENDVLTIRDTGIGISAEDLPRICERGFTGFNGRQEKTSSGLGLYLTRQILKKLSTPMEITSEPGKGTQVRLFLHKEKMKHF